MYLLSAEGLFTGKMVQALCWMLIHSLWQGLLLAGIVGLIILFTRQRAAALRYNLLTSAFVFFLVGISVTFCLEAGKSFTQIQVSQPVIGQTPTTTAINSITAVSATIGHSSFMDLVTGFFNRYATAIVFVWFLVISVRLAQMMAGLYGIQQIKTRKVSGVGSYWSLRVQQLSTRLGINQPVQFLQSGIVKVPMVVGYFKPVIFFPLGALASLSPADVEAILLHELGHIRRKDYLVNMLQHVVEILFFFNPAVLWVSALIKTERENCCDDIALSQTSNKRDYINALVSFQEFDEAQPRYATALTGKKDHLLQRVKRIVNNNNKSLNNMEKIFLIGCFLLTGTLTLVFSQTKKNKQATESTVQKKEITETKETLEEAEKADEMAKETVDFNLSDTPKNGKITAELSRLGELKQKLADEHRALMVLDSMNANVNKEKALKAKVVLDEQQKKLDEEQKQMKENRKKLQDEKKEAEKNISKTNVNTNTSVNRSVRTERIEDNDKYYVVTGLSYSVHDNISSGVNTTTNTEKEVDVKDITNNIIADLKINNIISNEKNLSYQLTNNQLVVNDKVQSEAVHAVLKAKYIKSPDWNLLYNWKMKRN